MVPHDPNRRTCRPVPVGDAVAFVALRAGVDVDKPGCGRPHATSWPGEDARYIIAKLKGPIPDSARAKLDAAVRCLKRGRHDAALCLARWADAIAQREAEKVNGAL